MSEILAYRPQQPPPVNALREWEVGVLKAQLLVANVKLSGWWLSGALALAVLLTAYAPVLVPRYGELVQRVPSLQRIGFSAEYPAVTRFLDLQTAVKLPLLAFSTLTAFTLFAQQQSGTYEARLQLQLRDKLITTWDEADEWRKKAVALARFEEEYLDLSDTARKKFSEQINGYAVSNRRGQQLGAQLGERKPVTEIAPGPTRVPKQMTTPTDVAQAKAEVAQASLVYRQSREAVIKLIQTVKIPVGHPILQNLIDSMSSSAVKSSLQNVSVSSLPTPEAARAAWRTLRSAMPPEARPAVALEQQMEKAKTSPPPTVPAVIVARPYTPLHQRAFQRLSNVKVPSLHVRWVPRFRLIPRLIKKVGKK